MFDPATAAGSLAASKCTILSSLEHRIGEVLAQVLWHVVMRWICGPKNHRFADFRLRMSVQAANPKSPNMTLLKKEERIIK